MENILNKADKRKYNIADRLDRAGRRRRNQIRRFILSKHGISQSSYYRWLELKKGESVDIPAAVVISFAQQLGVSVPELVND